MVLYEEMLAVVLPFQPEGLQQGGVVLRSGIAGYQFLRLAHCLTEFLRDDGLLQIGYAVAAKCLKCILVVCRGEDYR